MKRFQFSRCARWLLIAAAVYAAGCSKEKLDELMEKGKAELDKGVEQAKQVASDGTKAATDQANAAVAILGEMQVTVDAPVKSASCFAWFAPARAGRPAVLKFQSYSDVASEKFPSIFVQAPVQAASPTELIGKTFPAHCYVQSQQDGPVWFADSTAPVQLKVTAVNGKQISAELAGGNLTNTATGAGVPAAGKFSGSIQ